jgi:DmsE family decaheme c-type cytochrome
MTAGTDRGRPRSSKRGRAALLGLSALAVACATVLAPIPAQRFHRTTAVKGAVEHVGADECTACHDQVEGHAPIAAYHGDCESCHGPGERHAESEDVADIRFPSSEDCLACHEASRTTHLSWSTGEHERSGVMCSDCHNPHSREPHLLRQPRQVNFPHADADTQLCVSCHADVASRLSLPSHHPVREGMLSCTDCHAPHGDRRTALGGGTALCSGCHQDHAGPWVFEHAPVAEDCTLCHNPHGTATVNLLDTNQPALCLSCHSTPDSWHLRVGAALPVGSPINGTVASAFYTRCTDCHGAIHGSYEDPHLRK